jgi:hypothetical protein
VAIGVAVVTTSPSAKRAEESERAYQGMVDEYVRGKVTIPRPQVTKKMNDPSK